jgi:hypothetical protein
MSAESEAFRKLVNDTVNSWSAKVLEFEAAQREYRLKKGLIALGWVPQHCASEAFDNTIVPYLDGVKAIDASMRFSIQLDAHTERYLENERPKV